jgi:hypothetical protein
MLVGIGLPLGPSPACAYKLAIRARRHTLRVLLMRSSGAPLRSQGVCSGAWLACFDTLTTGIVPASLKGLQSYFNASLCPIGL